MSIYDAEKASFVYFFPLKTKFQVGLFKFEFRQISWDGITNKFAIN